MNHAMRNNEVKRLLIQDIKNNSMNQVSLTIFIKKKIEMHCQIHI